MSQMKISFIAVGVAAFLLLQFVCPSLSQEVHMQIDPAKCNLQYMRQIIMESCVRPHPGKKNRRPSKRHAGFSPELYDDDMDTFPFHLVPPNHSVTIIRRKRGQRWDFNEEEGYKYFKFCCENMAQCEQMDCPP